jgi:hypothetical protein
MLKTIRYGFASSCYYEASFWAFFFFVFFGEGDSLVAVAVAPFSTAPSGVFPGLLSGDFKSSFEFNYELPTPRVPAIEY